MSCGKVLEEIMRTTHLPLYLYTSIPDLSVFVLIYINQNSFISPAKGDICASQQPKDSNITKIDKNKQYNTKLRNTNRLLYT